MGVRKKRTNEPDRTPAGHHQAPSQAEGSSWNEPDETVEEGAPTLTFMAVGEATYVDVGQLVAVFRQNAQRLRREGSHWRQPPRSTRRPTHWKPQPAKRRRHADSPTAQLSAEHPGGTQPHHERT